MTLAYLARQSQGRLFLPQGQFHEERALDRIFVVRLNLAKAERAIHPDRLRHLCGERVQAHPFVIKRARLFDNFQSEETPSSLPAKFRPDVQPLHLTSAITNLSQSHAPGKILFVKGQQQSSIRRRVCARQLRQLFLEILKTETDAERRRVFFKQLARKGYI